MNCDLCNERTAELHCNQCGAFGCLECCLVDESSGVPLCPRCNGRQPGDDRTGPLIVEPGVPRNGIPSGRCC